MVKKLFSMVLLCILVTAGCSAPKPAEKGEFIDMFEQSQFASWISTDFESADNIPIDGTSKWYVYGLLTGLRRYYEDKTNIEPRHDENGTRYYSSKEIEEISFDVLGFNYPLIEINENVDNPLADRIYEVTVTDEGSDDTCWVFFKLDPDSYHAEGSNLTINAELSFTAKEGNEFHWDVEYQFTYMPDNKTIPYRFISSETIGETSPWPLEYTSMKCMELAPSWPQ